MTEKTGRKEQTHQKMVEAASRQFRSHGYAGIGVAGVAKAAGVTSGAFYDHFGSKDGAFAAALGYGLDEVIDGIPKFQAEHGDRWIEAFADYYLGNAHRDDRERVCAMTTLAPDVARAGPDMNAIYEHKMETIVTLIAHGISDGTEEDKRDRAWKLLSILIGGLTISRAVQSGRLADEIAGLVKSAALSAVIGA